jgi:hypothetical protein
MVEAGKARLVGQEPGEAGGVCTFETATGERFSLPALVVRHPGPRGAPVPAPQV